MPVAPRPKPTGRAAWRSVLTIGIPAPAGGYSPTTGNVQPGRARVKSKVPIVGARQADASPAPAFAPATQGGQIGRMPKTLVLLLSDQPAVAARARHVADGARQVRFAEVDVRRPADAPGALSPADYDALVLGVAADGAPVDAALRTFVGAHVLTDTVGAALVAGDEGLADGARGEAACWAALRALAAHGLLLVPPSAADDAAGADAANADEAARRLGHRVATVAGWVRHARGHAHQDGHSHEHSHPPA